jgi:putative sterol carrier protein
MYHVVVEATLAQPGQHFIAGYLEERDLLPAFRAGIRNVAHDEQRHIAFGVRMLHDLAQEDPDVPEAVADLLREAFPFSAAVFVPPGFDRRYTECFGVTLEEIYATAAESFEARMRAAGMPVESLPGAQVYPYDLPPAERATRALSLLQAGFLGSKDGPPARDPESMALLFDTVRRAVDPRRTPAEPLTLQWEFSDAQPWHLRVANGSTEAAAGRAEHADLELRCRYEDWVDLVAGRLRPRRALISGRLRPRGSLRALWAVRGLF